MYVGVILVIIDVFGSDCRIPHVCGGDPFGGQWFNQRIRYSPCMWG